MVNKKKIFQDLIISTRRAPQISGQLLFLCPTFIINVSSERKQYVNYCP